MTIGGRIKEARKAAGMTCEDVANKANIAAITLSQYERGVRQPRIERLEELSKILGVTTAYFIGQEPRTCVKQEAHFIVTMTDGKVFPSSHKIMRYRFADGICSLGGNADGVEINVGAIPIQNIKYIAHAE